MADETIGLDLELRLEGAQSVRELKQIIKDAKNEAIKFGEGTKEFDHFAKIAGKAADEVGDLNERVKALDPGEKTKAFQALGDTMIGGFQAATGALAVFSGDNEQLNQIMLKSMAIVQGLQGIQAIADAKKQLGTIKNILGIKSEVVATEALTGATEGQAVATTAATGASKALRGALIATGIGAIVVLVGLLIANWDKITKSFKGFDKVANEFKAVFFGMWDAVKVVFGNIGKAAEVIFYFTTGQFGKALDATKEFHSVSEAYQKGHEEELQSIAQDAANKQLEKTIAANKRKLAVMQAAGKDTYNLQRQILQDELSLLDKQSEDYAEKQNEIAVLDAAHKKELSDKAKAEQDKINAEKQKQAEKDKAENQKKIDAEIKLEEDKKKIRKQFAEDKLQFELSEQERELLALDRKAAEYLAAGMAQSDVDAFIREQELAVNKKYDDLQLQAQIEADKKSADASKAADERKLADAARTREAQLSLATSVATGITNIGILMTNNAKKQEQYNKIAAGIQIGIDTARGITSAVAAAKGLTGFDYVAQVALGVGTVLANAAKAKQLLSKVGASAPAIDTGSINAAAQGAQASAPTFNPTNQRTLLDEAERRRESGKQEKIIKTYVVESEMTESQKRIAMLKDRSVH